MSSKTTPTFNPAQLATYAEARALRDAINHNQRFVANPIIPGDDELAPVPVPDPNFPWLPPKVPTVGIYIPHWESGPHGDVIPSDGDKLFLHFRMKDGKDGFNVGLWRDKFERYPNSPEYVFMSLAADVANSG